MLIGINKIIVNDRIRKEFGDIEDLAADIADNGLINPPVVSPDFILIAGERRLRACKHLGWQQIEVRIISVKDYEHQLRLEISENQKRKNFTFSEGLEWARRLEQVEKLKARERSEANLKQSSEQENFPARKAQGQTRDRVAAETGFGSGKTYEKAKFVADHADAETIARLDAEETTIHAEYVRLKSRLAEKDSEIQRQAQKLQRLEEDLEQSKIAQKMLADLKKPDMVTVEKKVEVVPPDYEKLKTQLQKANENIVSLNAKLSSYQAAGERQEENKMRIEFFTHNINRFVRENATLGYFGNIYAKASPTAQREYDKSLTMLEKWCRDMRDQAIIPKSEEVYEMEAG